MPLKKDERKHAYLKVINLMVKQEHEKAFYELCALCGEDTGLFVIASYKEATEAAKHHGGAE